MIIRNLFFAMLLLPVLCMAQPEAIKKIAAQASTETMKRNLYRLASEEMEGRMMASHGDTLAALMVADNFKQQNLVAPFDEGKSYFQSITSYRQNDKLSLRINKKTYDGWEGWNLYPSAPVSLKNLPVVYTDFTTMAQWQANLPKMKLKGKAVIFNNEFFGNTTFKKIDSLENQLQQQGVKLIIWSSPNIADAIAKRKAYNFLPRYAQSPEIKLSAEMPEVSLTSDVYAELLGDKLVLDTGDSKGRFFPLKTKVSVELDRKMDAVQAPNVIGIIKGTDAEAGCVIISAHHDHDGMNGNVLYPGAMDNASGTVAIMEVAALMKVAGEQGLQPKRSIVFASYTGEERGLLGSYYLVNHPVFPVEKTYGVLNIDMLGRVDTLHANGRNPDSSYAYILVKDSLNRGLRKSLYKANEAVNLTLDTHYEDPKFAQRRIRGSDQYPFYERGVPFVRIDCGFAKEYHKPGDTPDKIDYNLLTKQTQLVFLTLWNMAND